MRGPGPIWARGWVSGGTRSVNRPLEAKARALAGLNVTNIPAELMPAAEVIASYHDLWHVEQSFRMSKTVVRARPMFHRTKDAIEAHLTIVFAALAVSRWIEGTTGWSIKKFVRTDTATAPSKSKPAPTPSSPPAPCPTTSARPSASSTPLCYALIDRGQGIRS